MDKFIFLDVDGVLNDSETMTSAPYGGTGLDDSHLIQLKHLVDTTSAKIILSSDWRFNDVNFRDLFPQWKTSKDDWFYLTSSLMKFDLHIFDITKDRCLTRGNEITMFLLRQTPPFSYVILDDLPIIEFTTHLPHLVHTNPEIGLTWDDIWKAQDILKIVEKRASIV